MDTVDPTRFVFAIAVVLGLIGLMALGLRRVAQAGYGGALMKAGAAEGRIRVVETRFLDSRRRLVLVRRDDREHLLLISGERELVIESDIPAPPAEQAAHA